MDDVSQSISGEHNRDLIHVREKVVLVTGAAGGQGQAHAHLLSSLGAKLILTDLEESEAKKVASQYENAIGVGHDVSLAADWKKVAERVSSEWGTLDVLVNNAGICVPQPLIHLSEKLIRTTIEVNLIGVILGMQAMQPLMCEKGGSIINIASTAGLRGNRNLVHYGASKWGVIGATRSAAHEFGQYGIRVNSICPGAIDTQMASEDARAGRGFITNLPIPRIGRPDEISAMVAFLASSASSYCTGHEFVIDGGQAA